MQHDPAVAIVRTEVLADVDLAGIDPATRIKTPDHDVPLAEFRNLLPAAEIVQPGTDLNDAAVVARSRQAHGSQGPNHAVLGSATAFEMNTVPGGQLAGIRLGDDLPLAAGGESRNSSRHNLRDTETWITAWLHVLGNKRTQQGNQRGDSFRGC